MKVLNVHEAKTKFSAVLNEVEKKGETICICRNGKPVADLVPHRKTDRTQPHPIMSKMKIDYDPTETLSEKDWPEGEDAS